MQGIFQKENTDKALKYGIYRHLPTYEKIIRNLISFYIKSTEERAQYDSKKVSKQAGIFMILIDVGLIALVSYIQFRAVPAIQNNTISNYGTEITIVSLGICAYIILVAMIAVIRGFKYSKK